MGLFDGIRRLIRWFDAPPRNGDITAERELLRIRQIRRPDRAQSARRGTRARPRKAAEEGEGGT